MPKLIMVIVTGFLLHGCTVGWHNLKKASPNGSEVAVYDWVCPTKIRIDFNSSSFTNTFGENESELKHLLKLKADFEATTRKTLMDVGCGLDADIKKEEDILLYVNITERMYISALPQEWCTGLSLGIIPSWGTRPQEYTYEFSQGGRTEVYTVDDVRINHLVLFPVFWLTLILMDPQSSYEKALLRFIESP